MKKILLYFLTLGYALAQPINVQKAQITFILTAPINNIVSPAGADLNIAAGAGNQNINLTPTGTGKVQFDGGVKIDRSANITGVNNLVVTNFSAAFVSIVADVWEGGLYGVDSGSTDAYAISLTPAITTYVAGVFYSFKANTANTGAATININGLGAKTIVKVAGGITTTLADNDIRAGQWVIVQYDGTNFQIQSTLGNAASGAGNVSTSGTITSGQTAEWNGSTTLISVANTGSGSYVKAGAPTFSTTPRTSGVASYLTVNIPADTGLTASTESIGYQHVTATRTWADGTVALQRENFFDGPTYAKTTTSATFTDPFTMYLTPPIAASGVTFTRKHSLGIVDSTSATNSITGAVVVATTLGTTTTSVGIGGGNVNAGGTVTGGTVTATSAFNAQGTSTHTSTAAFNGVATFSNATQFAGNATNTAFTVLPTAHTSGILPYIKWTIPTDTGLTASTEVPGLLTVTGTRQWSTGALSLQRENLFVGPTYGFVAASTLSDAFTMGITPVIQGTNATITRAHSLGILDSNSASSSITGGFVVASTFGTTGTSVGIGGGNVNAGGNITAGGAFNGAGTGLTGTAAALIAGGTAPSSDLGNCTGTINIDWSAVPIGGMFRGVLTGNTTFTFSNGADGKNIVINVAQTGTNSFTVTWPSMNWPGGTAPTMTAGAAASDVTTIVDVNGTFKGSSVQNFK